jgi:hypothetical protein
MEIKKVLHLSANEAELLVNSGKLLREISNGISEGTIDELSTDTANLLKALKEVISTIIPE